ncbi:MAG: hypothetical protein GVY34_10765 [Alphaproteobacteria bacterium]|jgi:hypothetical protein|nr:hypothetical protein [Alphaproteobacteria bacterium]
MDLIVDDDSVVFDLSRAFDRIPKTRLRAVEQNSSGLRFHLGCECTVRRVNGIAGQVVFDLVTPSETPVETLFQTMPNATPRPRPRPYLADSKTPFVRDQSVAKRAGARLAQLLREEDMPVDSDRFLLPHVPVVVPGSEHRAANLEDEKSRSTEAAQSLTDALTKAISGAVSRNLLSAESQFSRQDQTVTSLLADSAASHVRSQTSRGKLQPVDAENRCAEAVTKQVPDWSSPPANILQEQDWAALYDPLDRIDPQTAHSLGVNLLRLGFGAEARALFMMAPATDATDSLQAVSYLLDQEPAPNPEVLLRFAHCSDLDAFWAFLSAPERSVGMADTSHSLVRAIQALPRAMRARLGPSVVQHLLRNDDPDTAGLVQAAIARAHPDGGKSRVSAKPELLRALPAQMETLDANSAMELTDDELLLLLENAESLEVAVPLDLLEHAVERQFALRRGSMGRTMAQAAARGLARALEFKAAFDLATARESDLSDATRDALLSDLYLRLLDDADDTAFVTTVFNYLPRTSDDLEPAVVEKLSARLTALGFASEASALRAEHDDTPESDPAIPAPTDIPDSTSAARDMGTALEEPLGSQLASAPILQSDASQPAPTDTARGATVPQTARTASVEDNLPVSAVDVSGQTAPVPPPGGPDITTFDQGSDAVPTDTQDEGLLTQGRSILRDAEALRAQLNTLLDAGP